MSKIFYLLPSILIAGKLIASDPFVHPLNSYQGLPNDDLGAAKQQRIPMERLELHPDLPLGPTKVFPIDQGVDTNPVLPNPASRDDDLGGVVRPKPSSKPIIPAPTDVGGIKVPLTPIKHDSDDSDDDSVNIPAPTGAGGINKPQQVPSIPVKHDSDDSDDDSLVDAILNPNSSDEESLSDEDYSVHPTVGTPATEATRLNGNKPQGMFSRLFFGCCSVVKTIFCWPFRCFFWCCGDDSAASEKKSN